MEIGNILSELEACRYKDDGRIYISELKAFQQKIGKSNSLSQELWKTERADARELAVRIVDPLAFEEEIID